METLLAHCAEAAAGYREPPSSLWRTIDRDCDVGFSTNLKFPVHCGDYVANSYSMFFASLGGYLVSLECPSRNQQLVYVHSPFTKSWVVVGEVPIIRFGSDLNIDTVIVHSRKGELVLFFSEQVHVFKITLRGE